MSRYSQNPLRCTPDCLFGKTPQEVHDKIGILFPTLARDVLGYVPDGWITFVEMLGSSENVVSRVICVSTRPSTIYHAGQLLWCAVYLDEQLGYYRPRFLTQETAIRMMK